MVHLEKTDKGTLRCVCVCLCEGEDGANRTEGRAGSAGSATERQKQDNSLIVPSERLMAATHKDPICCVFRG